MIYKQNKKGFTLIELLVVVAILGALMTLVIVRFTGGQARALDTKRESELRQYQNALEIYSTKNASIYPIDTSSVSASSICSTLGLNSCPDDPKIDTGWPNYQYQSDAGGLDYVLWTSLEASDEIFVICSTGEVGKLANTWGGPSGGSCPL